MTSASICDGCALEGDSSDLSLSRAFCDIVTPRFSTPLGLATSSTANLDLEWVLKTSRFITHNDDVESSLGRVPFKCLAGLPVASFARAERATQIGEILEIRWALRKRRETHIRAPTTNGAGCSCCSAICPLVNGCGSGEVPNTPLTLAPKMTVPSICWRGVRPLT